MNKITEALIKRFESHRVIFWYDEKDEMSEQYTEVNITGVEKIHVQGNEFQIKHTINKVTPEGKFLLYFNDIKPSSEDNWLLDMELAHHVFHTDQEAMWLQEMGMGYHLKELVTEHYQFFNDKKRRAKLVEYLGEGDESQDIRYKMLAVTFGTENISIVSYIQAYSTSLIDGNDKFEKDLERFNLTNYFWGEAKRKYNYQSEKPSLYDFLIEVFNTNFSLGTPSVKLSKETRLLLTFWKDSTQYKDYLRKVSDKIAVDTDVQNKLDDASIDLIIEDDLFKLVDFKVIHELIHLISEEAISNEKVVAYVKQRENKFWFIEFESFYKCIEYASNLITLVRKHANFKRTSFQEGVDEYANTLYEIDLVYRKFIWNYRRTNQNKILADLAQKVEKVYSNDWLLLHNNEWQGVIDNLDSWSTDSRISQKNFFNTHVKPVIQNNRLFVIISDAFRYECGVELTKRLQSENRYEASLQHMVASLPSYTQLGMASLLPHTELTIPENNDIVFCDGMSSAGTQGRTKILEKNSGVRSTAIKAEEFMKMNSSKEGRDFVKQYDLIYIYHNRIDKTGDDKTTEDKVFEAVEEEFQFLMDMMKKIANMNGNQMMITSDHGFIYQHSELEESDFSQSSHEGNIWKENRRFVIGNGLSNDNATKAFKGTDLQINSDIDVLIPKSINRLRVKGAGSRFIHGGASLQEVVIPLIKIQKMRQDTTKQVDIDIIKSTDRITTNILAVSFIQSETVTDTILPRTIRAVLRAEDDVDLSDTFKYNFDIEEGSERQREVKHRFLLSNKVNGKYKNQRAKLILEEPIEGSTRWRQYKEYSYTLNISFTNDFDDF